MSHEPIPAHFFVLVVVSDGTGRFLLVHERKHGEGWYLPAGRVEPGESLTDAALRETYEESGVIILLTGVVRFEHVALPGFSRVRVIFAARPAHGSVPVRTTPNEHTLGAGWFSLEEMTSLRLRGEEVRRLISFSVSHGVAPLSVLGVEGDIR